MKSIMKSQKGSSRLLRMILVISIMMIEHLSFGSAYYGSPTQIETVNHSNFHTVKLQQAPDGYHENQIKQFQQESQFPGQGQKLGGIATSSNLVPEDFYLYSRNTNNLRLNAEQLIEESLRGPKEQATVLFFYKAPFVIDRITRMPVLYTINGEQVIQNNKQQMLPTVNQILQTIDLSSLSYESQEKTIEVLEIYLRAIDEAKQVAAIEAYFDANSQNYYFYQTANATLTDLLDTQAKAIRSKLDAVKKASPSAPEEGFNYDKNHIEKSIKSHNKNHIIFNKSEVNEIIENNDFRDKVKNGNFLEAATLLFQQCFIAQQQHLKDKVRFGSFGKESKEVKKNEYIFEHFPNFKALCNIAQKIANKDKKTANALLKDINQAVQTALYIAKKESNYYITTDPLVKILYDMHKEVDAYCINPEYGATPADINRNAMWSALATAGYGLAITGAAAGAYYYKDIPGQIGSAIYDNSKSLQALDKGVKKALTDVEKKLLATGQYVLDAAGNIVPNFSKAIKEADKAIAQGIKYITPKEQSNWEKFINGLNDSTKKLGETSKNFSTNNFTLDPMIEQYQ